MESIESTLRLQTHIVVGSTLAYFIGRWWGKNARDYMDRHDWDFSNNIWVQKPPSPVTFVYVKSGALIDAVRFVYEDCSTTTYGDWYAGGTKHNFFLREGERIVGEGDAARTLFAAARDGRWATVRM